VKSLPEIVHRNAPRPAPPQSPATMAAPLEHVHVWQCLSARCRSGIEVRPDCLFLRRSVVKMVPIPRGRP
jgi:hypothetical protein